MRWQWLYALIAKYIPTKIYWKQPVCSWNSASDFQVTPASAADLQGLAARTERPGRDPFRSPVTDFYLTNPIARCSAVMAECSALAEGRSTMTAAE